MVLLILASIVFKLLAFRQLLAGQPMLVMLLRHNEYDQFSSHFSTAFSLQDQSTKADCSKIARLVYDAVLINAFPSLVSIPKPSGGYT